MGADQVVSLVSSLLALVAQIAPGVLASLSGQRSDEDVLAGAEAAVRRLHARRAGSAIDRVAAEIGRRDTEPPPDERLGNGG